MNEFQLKQMLQQWTDYLAQCQNQVMYINPVVNPRGKQELDAEMHKATMAINEIRNRLNGGYSGYTNQNPYGMNNNMNAHMGNTVFNNAGMGGGSYFNQMSTYQEPVYVDTTMINQDDGRYARRAPRSDMETNTTMGYQPEVNVVTPKQVKTLAPYEGFEYPLLVGNGLKLETMELGDFFKYVVVQDNNELALEFGSEIYVVDEPITTTDGIDPYAKLTAHASAMTHYDFIIGNIDSYVDVTVSKECSNTLLTEYASQVEKARSLTEVINTINTILDNEYTTIVNEYLTDMFNKLSKYHALTSPIDPITLSDFLRQYDELVNSYIPNKSATTKRKMNSVLNIILEDIRRNKGLINTIISLEKAERKIVRLPNNMKVLFVNDTAISKLIYDELSSGTKILTADSNPLLFEVIEKHYDDTRSMRLVLNNHTPYKVYKTIYNTYTIVKE